MTSPLSSDFLDSLISFLDFATPVFIPSLLVFAYHSSLSLRTWFAVQNAPIHIPAARLPQPISLAPNDHQSRLTRLEANFLSFCHRNNVLATVPHLWLALTFFLGMALQFTQLKPLAVDAETFFRGALLPIFVVANSRLFATVTGVEKRLVFCNLGGRPFIQSYIRTDIEKALSFMPYLAAAVVSYRASFCGTDRFSLSVTYGALMHLLISSEITTARSFKTVFLCAAVNLLTVLVFILSMTGSLSDTQALFPFLSTLIERTQLIFSQRQYGHLNVWSGHADSETAESAKWPLFILSVLWSVFPADLISLSYRYDFHCHVTDAVFSSEDQDGIPDSADMTFLNLSSQTSGSPLPSTATTIRQAPNVYYDYEDSYDFDFGARIPNDETIPQFSMPYFVSVITTWVLCNVGLYVVLQSSGMTSSIEFHYVEALSALATMPAMALSLLVVAIFRRGVAPLWHFAEQWTQKEERGSHRVSITSEKSQNVY